MYRRTMEETPNSHAPRIREGEHFAWMTAVCVCPHCGTFLDLHDEKQDVFRNFLVKTAMFCLGCSETIDPWQTVLNVFRKWRSSIRTPRLAGATHSGFSVILEPGERAHVDLIRLGLPKNARIIDLTYSTGNGFRPLEISKSYQPVRNHIPLQYDVYALPDDSYTSETADVLIAVNWVAGESYAPMSALLGAVERYVTHDLSLVPLLATIPLEEAAKKALQTLASYSVDAQRARRFARLFRTSDLFSTALQVLSSEYLEPLPENIVEIVESCREQRNLSAHTLANEQTLDDVAEQLTAAFFTLSYLINFEFYIREGNRRFAANNPFAPQLTTMIKEARSQASGMPEAGLEVTD